MFPTQPTQLDPTVYVYAAILFFSSLVLIISVLVAIGLSGNGIEKEGECVL
jgi:hypothetical protein